MTLGLCPGTAL